MALTAIVLARFDSSNKLPEPVAPEVVTEASAPAMQSTETLEPTTEAVPETNEEVMIEDTEGATEEDEYAVLLGERAAEAEASMDLIIRLVIAEAGNQGYDGMRAVAQVIYDRRYNSSYNFGQTFEEIIYAPNQFATPYAGDISPWMPTAQEACEAVFYHHDMYFDEPVHYFYIADMVSTSTRNWFETKRLIGVLGAHTFRSDAE